MAPNEGINNTMDTKETVEQSSLSEPEASNEVTEVKAPESTTMDPNGGGMATALTTGELTIVVEDHSSPHTSVPKIHPFDNLDSEPTDAQKRTSIAESITQLQPLPSQHPPNELLLKRVTSWEYLGWVHHGRMAYFNTILLTEADLRRFYTPGLVQKR